MNKSSLSLFIKKSGAIAAMAALVALGAPFVALANQTVTASLSSSVSVAPSETAHNPIPVTATFSEGVSNFDASKITVTNGTVVNFAASTSTANAYTFGIAPASSGSTTVSIAGDAVQASADSAHTNSASNQLEFIANPSAGDASSTQAFLTLTGTGGSGLFSGPPGTTFNAVGTEFWPLEQVAVGFGAATSTVTADASGDFSTPFTADVSQSGAMQVTAIGATSGLVATNSFYVNPASTTATTTGTTATSSSTGVGAPVITIASGPADGSSVGTSTVTFGFTVNDPTATVTCTFGGGPYGCGSPQTFGPLGDSTYIFSVTAASSTGISTSTINFTVDTVAPVIAEVTPVPTPSDGTAAQYTFTSTEAGTINLGGGCSTSNAAEIGTTTITFGVLGSNTYNCTLSVTDAAGNVSNTLILTPFTVNAPSAPVTSGGGGSSGGGGGGGGGYVASGPYAIGYVNNSQSGQTAPVTSTAPGQVLGASTYNFTQSLSIGSSGEDVTQLQMVLIAGGFLSISSPTGYYGPLTAAAVKVYQQAHGLPQVGVVGPQTRAMLNQGSTGATSTTTGQVKGASTYNFATDLTVGSTGADVTALQNALTAAGDYTGPVTGYFGSLTEAAVKTYQTSKGISSTGYVGPLTRAQLNQGA